MPQPYDYLGMMGGAANLGGVSDVVQRALLGQKQSQLAGQQLQANQAVLDQQARADQVRQAASILADPNVDPVAKQAAENQLRVAAPDQYRALVLQRQQQADVGAFTADPTAAGALKLMVKYPALKDQMSKGMDIYSDAAKQAKASLAADVIGYLTPSKGGAIDQKAALAALARHRDADAAAGLPTDGYDQLAQTVQSDPTRALAIAHMFAAAAGGKDGADRYSQLGSGGIFNTSTGEVLREPTPQGELRQVKTVNPDGSETTSFVRIGGAGPGGAGAEAGQRFTGGWTPRAANGGDNSDAAVDSKIAGAAKFLGVGPSDDISAIPPMRIAQAMALSEGGAGSLADRNNNPANLRNADGSYKKFPSKDAGLKAAAALVARKLGSGQTTVQTMIEGLPAAGGQRGVVASFQTKPSGADGTAPGDTSLTGDAYLASLDPAMAAQVKAMSEGRMQLPTGAALRSPKAQQLFAAASQYDPNLDQANARTRYATRKEFTSGKAAQNITSFNTALHHIDILAHAADDLHNGRFSIVNAAGNAIRTATGSPAVVKFNTAKQAVVDELERAFRGTSGTLAGIKGWEESLNSSSSPEQIKGVLTQMADLLAGRIESLGEQYSAGMGKSTDGINLLDSKAKATMRRFGSGYSEAGNVDGGAGGPVRVTTRAEALKLAPGTVFVTPDGRRLVR